MTGARLRSALRDARLVTALVLVAWALLLAAWAMGNAPFAAPDEVEHFIRTVGISEDHLIGKPTRARTGGSTPTQVAWTSQAARVVSLPWGLNPEPFACELGPGERSAACQNTANPHPPPAVLVTAVGNYQPLPYLLPAAALRAGSLLLSVTPMVLFCASSLSRALAQQPSRQP